jgi:hypothetical protein
MPKTRMSKSKYAAYIKELQDWHIQNNVNEHCPVCNKYLVTFKYAYNMSSDCQHMACGNCIRKNIRINKAIWGINCIICEGTNLRCPK